MGTDVTVAAAARTAVRPAGVNVGVAAAARTAVRPVDGELAGWHPVELAGVVGREVLERAGLDGADLDEVIVGCADPVGACGADAARAIVLAAGWPVEVGGQVIDRGETSGLAAVQAAAAAIRTGQARRVLVIGLGLCSVVPPGAAARNRAYGAPWGGVAERFAEMGGLLPAPRLAERAARAAGIGRAELDAAAEESRRRRLAAGPNAAVVAVAARPGAAAGPYVRRGDPVAADAVRESGDAAGLPPAFDEDGLLTAATLAPPADAVAAVLLQAETAPPEPGTHPTPTTSPPSRGTTPPEPGTHPATTAAAGGESFGAASSAAPRGVEPAGPADEGGESFGTASSAAPRAAVAGVGRAAGDPFDPTGNVAASVGRALAEAGAELDAVDDIAVAENDAATALLVAQALGVDPARVNRSGGAVATGNAGAAEELRLIADGLAGRIDDDRTPADGGGPPSREQGALLLTVSVGATGSAAIVWLRPTAQPAWADDAPAPPDPSHESALPGNGLSQQAANAPSAARPVA